MLQVTDRDKTVGWAGRKANYLRVLQSASKEALAVACADKADNLSSIVEDYGKGGQAFLQSFKTTIWDKIQNYTDVYNMIRKLYPECNLLPIYHKHLEKAQELLQR